MELAKKIWKIDHIPMAHASVNDNYLLFTQKELSNPTHVGQRIPIVINLSGAADSDHAIKSSMSTVGWASITNFDGQTLWANGEVTNPEVGPKLERKTTDGRREIGGVSMGASMEKLCSICGGDIDECGHTRGQKYDGRLCVAIASNTKFDHLALTSRFADKDSTLDNSSVKQLEVATRVDLSKLTISRKGGDNMPDLGNPMAPQVQQPQMGLEEIAKRLEALEAKVFSETSIPAEVADVDKGNALPPEDSKPPVIGEQGLPAEIRIKIDKVDPMASDTKPIPPVAETSQEDKPKEDEPTVKEEEKEKDKEVKEMAAKYVSKVKQEVAVKAGIAVDELSSKSIGQLEAMLEVASKIKPTKGKVDEFASIEAGMTPTAPVKETAEKRIERLGVADALKESYELSMRGDK